MLFALAKAVVMVGLVFIFWLSVTHPYFSLDAATVIHEVSK